MIIIPKRAPAPKPIPEPQLPQAEPCDVLSVLNTGDDQWVDYRGRRIGDWLRARGASHGWTATKNNADALIEEIKMRGARVVISEAQIIPHAVAATVAAALPGVRIVHLMHGAPAWCASALPGQTYASILQSRDLPNVWIGTVSDPSAMAWAAGAKVIHLPNPIEIPDDLHGNKALPRPVPSDTLCVSLVSRSYPAKNWGGQLAALGILARRRPLRVICAGQSIASQRAHFEYLVELGVSGEHLEFSDWAQMLRKVAQNVHVGLACGFTDSLNLIAAEHFLLGIPVVGSPSTPWMLPEWRINPQDPPAIADAVEMLATDDTAGSRGRQIVRSMAEANEVTLMANLFRLIYD